MKAGFMYYMFNYVLQWPNKIQYVLPFLSMLKVLPA